MSAKYKSPSFLLPNEINTNTNPLNTDGNPATGTGVNSLYSMGLPNLQPNLITVDGLTTILRQLNTITISFWYYPGSFGGGAYLFNTGTQNGNGSFCVERYVQGLRIQWKNSSNVYQNIRTDSASGQPNIVFDTLRQWYHICAILDTTNPVGTDKLQIWVNGVRNTSGDKTLTGSGFGTSTSNNVTIGASQTQGSWGENRMDELAIFNKALTSTEIAALYGGTSPNIYPSNLMATNLNPIAYYPLGEQAQNTGKLPEATANVWQFPNGVLQDYVMDFDGNEKINCGAAKAYDIVTLSAWVKPDSPSTYAGIFGTRNGSNVDFPYQLTNLGGKFRFIADGTTAILSDNGFNSGVWYHVMGIADGTNLKMYVNGQLQNATASYSTPLPTPNNDLMIGAQWDTDVQYEWSGEISNAAIWNTDQTANKDNIYNNGSPQTTYTVTPQNWWKLNADSVYTPSAPNYTTALGFNSTKNDFDKVTVGDLTALATPSNDITISLWAKLRTTASTFDKYGMPYSDKSGSIYLSVAYGGVLKYESNLRGTSGLKMPTGLAPSEFLKWHHVVVTFSGTEAKLYYNGVLEDTGTAGSATNFGEDTTIGTLRNTTNQTYSFNGFISNVAVLQSALSASQVSTLFNFGTPETNISFSPIHNWKLDNLTTGLNDTGSLASNNGTAGSVNGTGPVQESTSVAAVPSWKIPSALPITTPNYTTALDFNGNGDYVTLNSSINLTGNKTVSYWVNPNSFGDVYIGGVQGIDYYTYMTSSLLYIKDSTGFDAFNITGHISTGSWYHICITGDGTNATLYINGDFISTINDKNPTIDAIGAYNNGGYSADAKMSNVQIFNSALPATGSNSVETLYNNGSPLTSMSGFTSLQGWWKLDSTTIIDSAGSNNGTNSSPGAAQVTSDVLTPQPVNGVSTTLPSTALQQSDLQFDSPYSNYSLSFDGNSYIDTNFTLPASYTSFSYSFWFKRTTSANPGTEYIISNLVAPGNNYDGRGLVRFGGANLRIQGGDGTGNTSDYDTGNISATAILDQNWHHIAITIVSGEIKTYFDGSLVNTYTNSLVVTGYAADRTYVIGQNGIGTGYLINSKLDEFAIFDKKLTEAEILSIYNNGKPSDISPIAPTNWWRLGENAYFVNNDITLPNSVSGAPNGVSSGTATSMLTADAPGTYANGIGTNLDIVDRVGDAALSTANSQSYNMIPDDKVPYVPGYVGLQTDNVYSMTFDGVDDYIDAGNISALNGATQATWSCWYRRTGGGSTYFMGNWGNGANTKQFIAYQFGSQGGMDVTMGKNTSGSNGQHTMFQNANCGINQNTWYHMVFVFDASESSNADKLKFYLDGTQITNNSAGGSLTSLNSVTTDFILAAPLSSGKLTGDLDEVAIFDEALTADQIKFDLYKPTSEGTNQTADIANNPNLPTPVAWYRMGD